MKILFLLSTCFALNCTGQIDSLTKKIQQDTLFELNYMKLNRYDKLSNKLEKSKKDSSYVEEHKPILSVFELSNDLTDSLFAIEKNNFGNYELLSRTNEVLHSYSDLKMLVALMKMVELKHFQKNTHNQIIRKKLIGAISYQMQIMAENTMPFYNYPIIKKQWLKGFQIETANDLFRFGLIQKNNDMDYTGALKISLITDLFKLDIFKPTQSYQVVSYGGEVYTPYFKDTNVFIYENSFNKFDRPHANFQFVGLENHGISANFRARWSTNVRIGLIGSRFGYNFQYFLHRDISISPYPTGWDAQIGYPGRLALQLNVIYEHLIFYKRQSDFQSMKRRPEQFRIVPSVSGELGVGHFMTFVQVGLRISTLNFKNQNQLSVLPKSVNKLKGNKVQKIVPFADLDGSLRYVVHNTTLTGYGVFKSKEMDNGFADESDYYLPKDRENPIVFFANLRVGIQFANFNIFYRNSIKSPEYKSAGFIYTLNNEKLNPNKRWHNYASIGVAFTI